MAQCKITAREFIANCFTPQIAAFCSSNAEATCQKNNLTFTEMLQPFCKLDTDGNFKDPQGTTITVRGFQISLKAVNFCPPEPNIARRMLNKSVDFMPNEEKITTIHIGNADLEVPTTVPWFEAWRNTFLNVQFPSDHEFTKHFLACMIVVSSADDRPLDKIQQIGAQLNQSLPGKLPKWFNNNALRYYVLIHDAIQDNKKIAEEAFSEMKHIYGTNNCFFLNINSRPLSVAEDSSHLPDPWSQFITKNTNLSCASDQDSSPRTPADTCGVASMPNAVIIEPEKATSQAGTPVAPRNLNLLTPDRNENINFASELENSQVIPLEVGQEAVPPNAVTVHPLSPENELPSNQTILDSFRSHTDGICPINVNVWADSPTNIATHYGTRLETQDLERLKMLISEFCIKSLLPYIERQIWLLNDLISNKKGVSRSLFSATKRWFGTTKPGVPGSVPSNAVIYTSESPELQLRRLGDLCFMFGHYTLAYQAYHNAKRDFAADQAWVYYAGALEMAALSAFMMDEMIRKTIEYMDDAITTYLNTCKMPQFATRATLLSAECLKNKGFYGEAAKDLIRMTSEDSDLRSALLLEQAAYCFIPSKMIRKYAFHAVLAGNRFSKAGQKKHSLRCYKQAYQVYNNKGWYLAEDHIHFTIGRQAAALQQVQEAVIFFEKLLSASSKQPALQQAAFLREFLNIHNLLVQDSKTSSTSLPILPLPLVEDNQIKVLLGPLIKAGNNIEMVSQILSFSQDADDVRWAKLEEIIVSKAQGTKMPMIFKPTVTIYTNTTNNTTKPNAIVSEPIYVCITLSNPLLIPLLLTNVKLTWLFSDTETGLVGNNEISEEYEDKLAETLKMKELTIQPASSQDIVLSLKPKKIGEIQILGISYDLVNPVQAIEQLNPQVTCVRGKRVFQIKGAKLKNIKEKPGVALYGVDSRLNINVIDKAPFLEIIFSSITPEMLCGELQCMEVTLKNIGNAPLQNIYLGSTNPKLFAHTNQKSELTAGQLKKQHDELITKIDLPSEKNGMLTIGDSFKMNLWLCAPYKKGNHKLDLLFYYESSEPKINLKYRLGLHSWHLTVLHSIEIIATVRRSVNRCKDNFSLLNVITSVKNSNQVQDPFMNEIQLTDILFQSDSWALIKSIDNCVSCKVKPQEIIHFVLKLAKKGNDASNVSIISLQQNNSELVDIPHSSFITKRHYKSLEPYDTLNDPINLQTISDSIACSLKLDSILILRWKANITEGGSLVRNAMGQHYVDLHYLHKLYNHPVHKSVQQVETLRHLKIFGPDINIPNSQVPEKKNKQFEMECQQNLIWSYLTHSRDINHDFHSNRLCVMPVHITVQNNSNAHVSVKLDTIGTSSQTILQSMKTQLYSPQASTSFRYVGHTSSICELKPQGKHEIGLKAMLPSCGTYDLASRIEISAKLKDGPEYTMQKWRMESIVIVSNKNSMKV